MAKIVIKKKPEPEIPSSSMGDISFLLLLFFMVSTVFVKERGLAVTLPDAETIEKIPRSHASTIYISRSEVISIDDFTIPLENVTPIMQKKLSVDFNTIVAFRTDKFTRYGVMSDIIKQLQEANALRVSFEAKRKG